LPFFKLLKKKGLIQWTPEAEAALENLKRYLASPPILVTPKRAKPLLLYVAAMTQVVSAVLVAEREEVLGKAMLEPNAGGCPAQPTNESPPPEANGALAGREPPDANGQWRLVQCPVYFVSTVLRDGRERYPEVEKLLLGVFLASRKLRHYFEAHRVMVVTLFPLERVLHNRSTMGRIAEWSLELSDFDLHFTNTTTIKSRVDANPRT
jgi:hypothetical protein